MMSTKGITLHSREHRMFQELGSTSSELKDKLATQKLEYLSGLSQVWVPIKGPCIYQKLTVRLKEVGCKEKMECLLLG